MSVNIFIKTLSGKTITLSVSLTDTIQNIKEKIHASERLPVTSQRILFHEKDLDDKSTLQECNIKKESVLQLILKKNEEHFKKLSEREQKELNVAQSASASKWYNAAAGLNDELLEYTDSESKFDVHNNPQGAGYDLGKDGEFSEFVILIGSFVSVGINQPMEVLKVKGFKVVRTNSESEFIQQLGQADIAWILSGTDPSREEVAKLKGTTNEYHPAWKETKKEAFALAVNKYHKNGGALYIWGDNAPLFEHANAVLPAVLGDNVQLVDNTPAGKPLKLGEPTKCGFFGPHIINTGVINLYEGVTICYPSKLGPLKVLATSTDNHPVICYADNEALKDNRCGRIVVDCGYTKLYTSWDAAGAARYIVNACIWLLGLEHKLLHDIPIEGKNVAGRKPKPVTTNNDINNNSSNSSSNNNNKSVDDITKGVAALGDDKRKWTVAQVHSWMSSQKEFKEFADRFKAEDVDGSVLPDLAKSDLVSLGVSPDKIDGLYASIRQLFV